MAPISQREARRLWKRVGELERQIQDQRKAWSQEYFGAREIGSATFAAESHEPTAIRVARKLGHAVVVVGNDTQTIRFMALPHPDSKV